MITDTFEAPVALGDMSASFDSMSLVDRPDGLSTDEADFADVVGLEHLLPTAFVKDLCNQFGFDHERFAEVFYSHDAFPQHVLDWVTTAEQQLWLAQRLAVFSDSTFPWEFVRHVLPFTKAGAEFQINLVRKAGIADKAGAFMMPNANSLRHSLQANGPLVLLTKGDPHLRKVVDELKRVVFGEVQRATLRADDQGIVKSVVPLCVRDHVLGLWADSLQLPSTFHANEPQKNRDRLTVQVAALRAHTALQRRYDANQDAGANQLEGIWYDPIPEVLDSWPQNFVESMFGGPDVDMTLRGQPVPEFVPVASKVSAWGANAVLLSETLRVAQATRTVPTVKQATAAFRFYGMLDRAVRVRVEHVAAVERWSKYKKDNRSAGERQLDVFASQYLDSFNTDVIAVDTPWWEMSKRTERVGSARLRPDMVLRVNDHTVGCLTLVMEHHGLQHYRPVGAPWSNELATVETRSRDSEKAKAVFEIAQSRKNGAKVLLVVIHSAFMDACEKWLTFEVLDGLVCEAVEAGAWAVHIAPNADSSSDDMPALGETPGKMIRSLRERSTGSDFRFEMWIK